MGLKNNERYITLGSGLAAFFKCEVWAVFVERANVVRDSCSKYWLCVDCVLGIHTVEVYKQLL